VNKLRPGVRAYLRPYRRELVRIAGIADTVTRYIEFRRFWSANCAGWGKFDSRLSVPRSLRGGLSAARVQLMPLTKAAQQEVV
jgi:hypothetical protein